MLQLSTMNTPQVGDRLVGAEERGKIVIACNSRGHPISDQGDYPHREAGTFPVEITEVGAHWSDQIQSRSGWYVAVRRIQETQG